MQLIICSLHLYPNELTIVEIIWTHFFCKYELGYLSNLGGPTNLSDPVKLQAKGPYFKDVREQNNRKIEIFGNFEILKFKICNVFGCLEEGEDL